MSEPPENIGGAEVVIYTKIDERRKHTGNCQQIVAGVFAGAASGLAICRYLDEEGYYLFGCDENWNTLTDTWHETLENAMKQAEFEYEGVGKTWQNL